MSEIQPNNEFKAVFNPFTKELAVRYGNDITHHTFEETEEWVCISFDANANHPNYLHVQIDYDESLQLLFYPRTEDSESLNEELGIYFNSNMMDEIPDKIILAYNDQDFQKEVENL